MKKQTECPLHGKKNKTAITETIIILAFVIGISGIVFSTKMFTLGFHNIDAGYNMRGLNCELDVELLDKTIDGTILTEREAYAFGVKQIFLAFYLFGISVFVVTASFITWGEN